MKCLLHARHQYGHAHQAIYDGRNSCQKLYGSLNHRCDSRGCGFRQEHGGKNTNRYSQDYRPRRTVDAGQNEWQDAELILTGFPGSTEQEFDRPDFVNGRNSGNNQVHADQQHEGDTDKTTEQEQSVYCVFH